jgi:hypothetical protein
MNGFFLYDNMMNLQENRRFDLPSVPGVFFELYMKGGCIC